MTTPSLNPVHSEKGIALIAVLLLLGVLAGLTTGLALSGQTEVSMASNEMYYAGARAAAEAGLNRATEQILLDTTTELLGAGAVPVIGNGPHNLDAAGTYTYRFEIVDDDDPAVYDPDLTEDQWTLMGENGLADSNINQRMILRAIGTGPRNTEIIVSRILTSVAIPDLPTTTVSDPAILINGDLYMHGNNKILGAEGNVHANGDLTKDGASGEVSGDVTATGTLTANDNFEVGGTMAGGMPSINVPNIQAADYFGLADWVLTETGTIESASTPGVSCTSGCPSGWTFESGSWSATGSMPTSATYYVKGDVTMKGVGKSELTGLSLIAEGSITLSGNSQFKPENTSQIQFVANGDLSMGVDADVEAINVDGQILVREQLKIHGNATFQGRVMAQDIDGDDNVWDAVNNPNGRRGTNVLDTNELDGTITVTYEGSLGDIVTEIPGGPPTYNNNVLGWLEQ